MILPQDVTERARGSKTLSSSLKRVLRVAAVGVAGISAWMVAKSIEMTPDLDGMADSVRMDASQPIMIVLSAVIAILAMELFVLKKRG